MIRSFNEIKQIVSSTSSKKTIAVASAEDEDVLAAVKMAREAKLAEPVLVGDIEKIKRIAGNIEFDLAEIELIEEKDPYQAARKAVFKVRNKEADMLMKGMLSTATILRAVLDKESGLRSGKLLSYMGVFELPHASRLLLATDCGMNIAPNFNEKVEIVENALQVSKALEIECAKVAAICAVETVNQGMPATIEAAALAKMSDRGQIKGAIIDGPLSLDLAISEEARNHKGIESAVAGQADILLMPNIEAGNVLYKSIVYLAKAQNAGLLLGATAPIVVTSRADSAETKLNSIALSMLISSDLYSQAN